MLRTGEVLEVVPGLIVTQHSGDGKANQYFLRGFNLDHGTDFATRVDGMPVNMPTHGHGQGYSDINFLIPELVDRIEYKKGTYYADEGNFSAAGAVDRHVPPPSRRRLAVARPWAKTVRARAVRRLDRVGGRRPAVGPRLCAQRRTVGPPRRLPPREGAAQVFASAIRRTGFALTAWATTAAGTPPTRFRNAQWIRVRSIASAYVDPTDGGESRRTRYSLRRLEKPLGDGKLEATAYGSTTTSTCSPTSPTPSTPRTAISSSSSTTARFTAAICATRCR